MSDNWSAISEWIDSLGVTSRPFPFVDATTVFVEWGPLGRRAILGMIDTWVAPPEASPRLIDDIARIRPLIEASGDHMNLLVLDLTPVTALMFDGSEDEFRSDEGILLTEYLIHRLGDECLVDVWQDLWLRFMQTTRRLKTAVLSREHFLAFADSDARTFKRGAARVGRNDHCPCGSGKKFKKCCA